MPWAVVTGLGRWAMSPDRYLYRGYSQAHIRKIKREHRERYLRRMVKEANTPGLLGYSGEVILMDDPHAP